MPKKKLSILILVILLVAAVIVLGILKIFSGPALGVITEPTTRNITKTSGFDFTPVAVTSPDASFDYPKGLFVMPSSAIEPPTIATFNYGYKDSDFSSWQLAISIIQLSRPSLDADGSYLFRQSEPTVYNQSTVSDKDNSYTVMTDSQASGFSKVAFALDGTMVAEISLTGNDVGGNTNLQETFNMVLGTWKWQ